MGRLPALSVALAALACGACNEGDRKPVTVTRERSQAVVASGAGTATSSTTAAANSPAAPSAAPAQPARKLCAGQMDRPGKPFPKLPMAQTAAPSARSLPAQLDTQGNWTWVNFWAAWCGPCKEEIPRLRSWEKKLNAAGKSFALAFISMDDDPRQLAQFLASQPEAGLQSTYWLQEGDMRERWLTAAGVSADPELPFHLLVDPQSKIRCVVNGAVEDHDFETVESLVR